MYITSAWIIIFFPLYELYKIIRISVICCSTRACSECAMIRPPQHDLAVFAYSMPILSLLMFIYTRFFSLEVQWEGNYGGVSLCCFKFLSVESGETSVAVVSCT